MDVTAQVKDWITNPASNFGWAIAPALSAPGTVALFDSKENTATGHVARLDITHRRPHADLPCALRIGHHGHRALTPALTGAPVRA